MKTLTIFVVSLILAGLISVAEAGDLKLRHYFNDSLSIGVDKGAAISYWDTKDMELLGGYSIPFILYEFPDDNELLGEYDVSLDTGIVGDMNDFDVIVGLGTNAPKIATQYLIDISVNKITGKDLKIPDKIKVGFVLRSDINRLVNEGEIAVSWGIEFGYAF